MKNKISVYELLGLIKDGRAPKKIEYKGFAFGTHDSKST